MMGLSSAARELPRITLSLAVAEHLLFCACFPDRKMEPFPFLRKLSEFLLKMIIEK